MRRRLLLTSVLTLSVPVSAVFAQAAPEPAEPAQAAEPAPAEPAVEPGAEPAEPAAPPPAPAPAPEGQPPANEGLAPPQLAPLDLEGAGGLNAQGPTLTPDPGDVHRRLPKPRWPPGRWRLPR